MNEWVWQSIGNVCIDILCVATNTNCNTCLFVAQSVACTWPYGKKRKHIDSFFFCYFYFSRIFCFILLLRNLAIRCDSSTIHRMRTQENTERECKEESKTAQSQAQDMVQCSGDTCVEVFSCCGRKSKTIHVLCITESFSF